MNWWFWIDYLRHRLGGHRVLAGARCRPQGHSFFGYFVLSLFFFPLALILAYVAKDRAQLA